MLCVDISLARTIEVVACADHELRMASSMHFSNPQVAAACSHLYQPCHRLQR